MVYLHLPFHVYQAHAQKLDSTALNHLSKPLNILNIIEKLDKHGFSVMKSGNYGEEPMQYVDCVLRRFDDEEEKVLWESSEN